MEICILRNAICKLTLFNVKWPDLRFGHQILFEPAVVSLRGSLAPSRPKTEDEFANIVRGCCCHHVVGTCCAAASIGKARVLNVTDALDRAGITHWVYRQ